MALNPAARTTWYHGGYPYLHPGDLIEPPDITGHKPLYDVAVELGFDVPEVAPRTDCVYLVMRPEIAAVWAANWTADGVVGGRVYRVEPCGPLARDPSSRGGLVPPVWTCSAALVIAAHPERIYPNEWRGK